MAKLCSYYALCPLIDQNSLLGVAEDSTSDCAIVTLGRNMVIRYKLLHQKQINSWSSKEKLSSPVVYDEVGNQYIAVFNRSQIKMWTDSDVDLDKIKKIKFRRLIHCVLPQKNGNEPLVIFSNRDIQPLSSAIENRKIEDSRPVKESESIEDCHLGTYENNKFVTFFSHKSKDTYFHVVPISEGFPSIKLKLKRQDVQLMGQTTIQKGNSCNLLTLWSDGKLFSLPFLPQPYPKPPGNLINTVRAVSTKNPVALTPLSSTHVAMYGADPSDEGAALIIYNVQFGVVQSRHHFKLCSLPPRLWCTGSNLIITTVRHLVVVPYQLEAQRLSSLVGARCTVQSTKNVDVLEINNLHCAKWITSSSVQSPSSSETDMQVPEKLKKQIQELQSDGYPQFKIMETILPQLLENNAVSELEWCIKKFSDISEGSLVAILKLCLDNGIKTNEPHHQLLLSLFNVSYSDVNLLPRLRTISFPQTLTLLHYLANEFEAEEPSVEVGTLIEWTSLLLDAHYQRYLLSGDPQILELLTRLRNLVIRETSYMEEWKEVVPLLQQFQQGRLSVKKPQYANKFYSIEWLRLY